MSDPYENGGLSTTFKQDGKDGMWLVFHGTVAKQRDQIIEAFGMDPAAFDGEPLIAVVTEANKQYKAITTVGRVLGGSWQGKQNSDAWTQAAQQQGSAGAEPQRDPLFDTIAAVTDIPTLKQIWAENRDKLDKAREGHDAELVAAWNARGKEIKEGNANG